VPGRTKFIEACFAGFREMGHPVFISCLCLLPHAHIRLFNKTGVFEQGINRRFTAPETPECSHDVAAAANRQNIVVKGLRCFRIKHTGFLKGRIGIC